ncbi:MAG: CPBP family intramembrane metalloprotease [Bacteroides sp.]|nr:CPBP family intramembrane metalloprotease [Prevotella sp.]MCM1407272.1 CPBP family intramembrane metalloprotease [Treponema brennaborense]MCM1469760.1 CPBP family intramembrane metalloprotease [Bacteroides sp.]
MHQLIYITAEVLAAAAIFAVPPLRAAYTEAPVISVSYPIVPLVFYAAAACFFLFACRQNPYPPHSEQRHDAFKNKKGLSAAVLSAAAFVLLLLFSFLWQRAAAVFSAPSAAAVSAPNTPALWANFAAGTAVYACCEEFIFRIYFPQRFRTIRDLLKCRSKIAAIAAEIIPAALFALAHRYLGFFAVANAAFAAGILRLLYLKTDSIPSICAVHAAYNFVQFFVLFQKN